MKLFYTFLLTLSLSICALAQGGSPGDIVSTGNNSWLFHTPDSASAGGNLHILPFGGTDWNWNAQTHFHPDGKVVFSSDVAIGRVWESPRAKLDVAGNIFLGQSSEETSLRFVGLTGDGYGGYNHTVIAERLYGAADLAELLLFKGNDPDHPSIGDRIRFDTTGSIVFQTGGGYRTYSPAVEGSTRMIINSAGNVGIGTINPLARLNIAGTMRIDNETEQAHYFANISAYYDSAHPFSIAVENNTGGSASEILGVYSPGGGGHLNSALGLTGNVGIGTTNPTHKLAVNGTIKAKEVIVETTGWSDYVFADDYALAPLTEVEAHIKEHKHLPGIPSAAQVAEQGVSVGEMQAKLLAKIEELTLHQIAQEKRLAAQDVRIETLERENTRLQARR